MKFKKLFLILITFITASFYFSSCFNTVNDSAYPLTIPEPAPSTKYATLQGRISFEGAMPSELLTSTGTGSQRTAMPEIESTWVYVLQASATGQPAQAPVTVPVSSPTYFYPDLPTSQTGILWTVTVRLKKSATANDDTAIMIDECAINLTDDSAVYIHDFFVRPVSGTGTEGSLFLTMTVPESVTNITVDPNNLGIVISTPATPNPPTGTPKTVNITGNLPAGSHSVRFYFYNSIGLLLYSNRQSINVFHGCETNIWVNNGGNGNSDPINSGSYTVTDTMISNFQLDTFYIGSSVLTSNSGTLADGYTGSPAAPLSNLADAVKIIKNRNNSSGTYTLLVRGSVTGNQVLGDSSNTSDCYIEGKAASITIMGARGLSNGLPQDQLNAGNSGTTLTINTSVPVKIENLLITGGNNTNGNGGGIAITGGSVELSNGTVVNGNTAKKGGGVYLTSGNLYLNGTAVVGKPGTVSALPSYNESTSTWTYGNMATETGGGIGIGAGTLWLGYSPATTPGEDPTDVTTTGGVIYNLVVRTGATQGGGIDNSTGTIKIAHGFVSYNYACGTGNGQNDVGSGGGISTTKNLTLQGNAEISHNESSYGGAVYIGSGGNFTMSGGTITSNASKKQHEQWGDGGGVAIGGGGNFTMSGGTISSNTAGRYGGAVFHNGTKFEFSGGTNCTASIPKGNLDTNNIHLHTATQTVIMSGSTSHTGTGEMALTSKVAARGLTVLTGDGVADYYSKFKLTGAYGMGIKNTGKIDLDVIVTDIYINQSAAAANSFEPSANTKNDSTWNNSTYAFNASADSSQAKPFKKMDAALKFITYQASEQDYTIHIVGTYTVNSTDTQNVIANNTSTDNPIKLVKTATQSNPTVTAKSITITGTSDASKIVGGITPGGFDYRCLSIRTEVPVIITNLSIEGGANESNSGAGGINIDEETNPGVSDVTLSTGTKIYGNNGKYTGAITNYGTLKIAGASIYNNRATDTSIGRAGAISNIGGTLYIYDNATIIGESGKTEAAKNETNKYSNYGKYGGAIFNTKFEKSGVTYYGTIYIGKDPENNLSEPKIEYNYSSSYGGGIYNSPGCTIEFYGGSISHNTAATYGGGIYNAGILSLTNLATPNPGQSNKSKTIKVNNAPSGGAIYEYGENASLTFMPTSSSYANINIPCDDSDESTDEHSGKNTIYLGQKSGTDPCQIILDGAPLYSLTEMRIDTNFSTYKGKVLIKTSDNYTPSIGPSYDYQRSILPKFKFKQPSGITYPYYYSSEKLTTTPQICQSKIGQATVRSNVTVAAVGDIVMKDGSIIQYEDSLDLGSKKNEAIAIIFYNGTELSSDSSRRVLGMTCYLDGIDTMKWSEGNPEGNLPGLAATVNGTTFTSVQNNGNHIDGRANYPYANGQITGTTAMTYCLNYYQKDSNLTGDYQSGWYLPSISELYKIYENITTIDTVFKGPFGRQHGIMYHTFIGGAGPIRTNAGSARNVPFWSSNTEAYVSGDLKIWSVYLGDVKSGDTRITAHEYNYTGNSNDTGLVMPIRQFN